MCDDLNTPKAFASFFRLIGYAEKALKRGDISFYLPFYAYSASNMSSLNFNVVSKVN